MKLKDLTLPSNVFAAPMAGVTDRAFRRALHDVGNLLSVSEMVSATALHYQNQNTIKMLRYQREEEGLVGLQLFGKDPEMVRESILRLNDSDFPWFDFNMGCPAPKIVKNGEGSFLMTDLKKSEAIVKAAVKASKKPFTVKIRLGFTEDTKNAVEVAKMLEESGVDAITVHGRTRDQFYSGDACWEAIAEVKAAVKIPIIGNGDVVRPKDAERMIRETGVDGVMIGRALEHNPFVTADTMSYLNGEEVLPKTAKEKMDFARCHLDYFMEEDEEWIIIKQMRKYIAWYTKGFHNSTLYRVRVNGITNYQDMVALIDEITEEELDRSSYSAYNI